MNTDETGRAWVQIQPQGEKEVDVTISEEAKPRLDLAQVVKMMQGAIFAKNAAADSFVGTVLRRAGIAGVGVALNHEGGLALIALPLTQPDPECANRLAEAIGDGLDLKQTAQDPAGYAALCEEIEYLRECAAKVLIELRRLQAQ